MTRLLIVLLLSALSLAARAQEYYLDLIGPLPTAPRPPMAIEQVLDGRASDAAIGMVYRGLGNKPAAVLFRHGLETDLTQFLQAQLVAQAGSRPVVLCVRQLRVGEGRWSKLR